MDKIQQAADKALVALKAAIPTLTDEVGFEFADSVRHLLRDKSDSPLGVMNQEVAAMHISSTLAGFNRRELTEFFKNLLVVSDPIEKEIPGRYAVETSLKEDTEAQEQYAFWANSFKDLLKRFAIDEEAFRDRFSEHLEDTYPDDSIKRASAYSDVIGGLRNNQMSFSNYKLCAKLLGFTHIKVELI